MGDTIVFAMNFIDETTLLTLASKTNNNNKTVVFVQKMRNNGEVLASAQVWNVEFLADTATPFITEIFRFQDREPFFYFLKRHEGSDTCTFHKAIIHEDLGLTFEDYDWFGSDIITGGKPLYNPRWEIGFEGKYILNNKFIFTANAKVGFDRWAVVPTWSQYVDEYGNPIGSTFIDYILENDIRHPKGSVVNVKPVLNFGLGFEYLITKQFTAFANINNIGCQYATNYYGFNNFGINAIVGITYSFGNEAIKPMKKKSTTKS